VAETVSERSETTPLRSSGREVSRRLLNICLALAISTVEAELLLVSRFLRDVIHGRYFWYHFALLLLTIGIVLGLASKSIQSETESPVKDAVKGILSGFLGSFVAILGTPLLANGNLASALYVWKRPLYLIYAMFWSLGWIYGMLTALALYLICRNRYKHIALTAGACAVIGMLERIPIVRWIR
jgi:hypothetical protein